MQKIRDYRIISLLGEGGMGKVYLAEDETLGRKVAIKVLDHNLSSNPDLIERFKQEARAQANLHHPNIITLHTYFEENGSHCIVLEYVNGMTLKQIIREKGVLKEKEALDIFYQILDGVGEAHQMGIVHRDLKPSNIMIDVSGSVKIMDFGIAKILGDRGMTKTGHKMGTMFYMSPEQVRAQKDIDQKTDIYSLGIVLFEMLTGKVPFDTNTESDYEVMDAIVKGNLKLDTLKPAGISENLISVITRMTAVERNERFPTCLKVREELEISFNHKIQDDSEINSASSSTNWAESEISEKIDAPLDSKNKEKVNKSRKWYPKPKILIGTLLILMFYSLVTYIFSTGTLSSLTSGLFSENYNVKTIQNHSVLSLEEVSEMVLIKGGKFRMTGQNLREGKEFQQDVILSDYYIGKYEVTQELWNSIMKNDNSFEGTDAEILVSSPLNPANKSFNTGIENLPVEMVSWFEAIKFCNKLSEKEGLQKVYTIKGDYVYMNLKANGYRLPTEAEWEFAAMGGLNSKGFKYSGSDKVDDVAFCNDMKILSTQPIGKKLPNELGIYDMSGNVIEWCWDWYGDFTNTVQKDPLGPAEGQGRVCRGGSTMRSAYELEINHRSFRDPNLRIKDTGFRLVRSKILQ